MKNKLKSCQINSKLDLVQRKRKMSIKPFSDLGKETSDLLGKDFVFGLTKLELNTVTANNVKFTVSGNF